MHYLIYAADGLGIPSFLVIADGKYIDHQKDSN